LPDYPQKLASLLGEKNQ